MSGVFPMVVAAAGVLAIVAGFLIFSRGSRGKGGRRRPRNRDSATIIRNATRRLAQNPKDADALTELADIYYQEEDYTRAAKHYHTLIGLCATNDQLDEFSLSVRYATSQLRLDNYEEAYKSLMVAKSMKNDDFDVNFNLGVVDYRRKDYEKAVPLLRKARLIQPDHVPTARHLGLALFHRRRYAEALSSLTTAVNDNPGDKEILFAIGRSFFEVGNNQRALRVFAHLRGDPKIGAQACLYAGTINVKIKHFPQAIADFEIGLKHEGTSKATLLELKYRLAMVYIKEQKIPRALELLKEISEVQPDYKDVKDQRARYQELASNKLLHTYMMAPNSEFVGLCRQIATSYFADAISRPVDISIRKDEWVDVLCEVSHPRWEDQVLFRFVRSHGAVGDMVLREMYSRIRDIRAGRGLCLTVGSFTEGASAFVEARLIDLVDKDPLLKMFKRLST